jgi:hypothetical protein
VSPALWSWLLTAVGITGLFVVSRGRTWGWLINIAGQVLWLAYAIVTGQHGFIVASLLYGGVFVLNYRRACNQVRSE